MYNETFSTGKLPLIKHYTHKMTVFPKNKSYLIVVVVNI